MFFILICLIVLLGEIKGNAQDTDREIVIHPNGNSWVVNDWQKNRRMISRAGVRNWADQNDRIRTYFRLDQEEEIALSLHVESSVETSIIKETVGEHTKNVELNSQMEYIDPGSVRLESAE